MIERICGSCRAANALERRSCHGCGRALPGAAGGLPPTTEASQPSALALLARRVSTAITPLHSRLPAPVRLAARPVALGLAAVAVELGAALLQRRIQGAQRRPSPQERQREPQLRQTPATLIIGQRVVEEYEQGALRRRIVERCISRHEP